MKFSTVIIAAAALMCAQVSASQSDDVGEVKGVPLVFDSPVRPGQNQFFKGEAIIHSRSEDLATSKIAVPDAGNPYIKIKGTGDNGIVGAALSAEKPASESASESESASSTNKSSAWTLPLAIGGCAIAVVGVAGFLAMKKRQQNNGDDSIDETKTPGNGSPQDELVDYNTEMDTPV